MELNALARRVHEVVSQYSRLPDAIIQAQCLGIGKQPANITVADLPLLAERIASAVSMFTNPAKGSSAKSQILSLCD